LFARLQVLLHLIHSLQSNYGYYQKVKTEFEKKQSSANDEINAMQKKYQNRAMQLQQKAATMNQKEQESAMQEMNKMQQDLQSRKQSIDNELYNYNSKMKEDILVRIQNFLKDYNKDGKYSYIFSYEPGFMFYKDSTLNVTGDVIQGLNQLDSSDKK
jgi:outer membrane protein